MNWYRTSQEDEDDLGMADVVRDVLAQGTWDDASSVIMKMVSDLCRGAFLSRPLGQVSEDVAFRVETMAQQFPSVHIRNYIAEGLSWMKQVAVEASLSAISGMDFHEAGHHTSGRKYEVWLELLEGRHIRDKSDLEVADDVIEGMMAPGDAQAPPGKALIRAKEEVESTVFSESHTSPRDSPISRVIIGHEEARGNYPCLPWQALHC